MSQSGGPELRVRAGTDRRAPVRAVHQRSRLLPALAGLIIAILILQLGLLTTAVYAARGYAEKAANVAVTSAATVIAERLDAFFATAVSGAGLASYTITATKPGEGDGELIEVLYRSLALAPELASIHVVRADGSAVDVTRTGDGYALHKVTAGGAETTVKSDADFEVMTTVTKPAIEDPRDTPEYFRVASTREAQWLSPHVVDGLRNSRLAYSLPVLSPAAGLVAVVWVEVSLDAISNQLDKASLGTGSAVLLVDASQRVVAAPADYQVRVRNYEIATGVAMPVTGLGLVAAHPLRPVSPSVTDGASTTSIRRSHGWLVAEQRVLAGGVPDVRIYVRANPELVVAGASTLIALFRAIAIALAVSAVVTPVIALAVRGRMSVMASRAAHDHLTGIANRDEVIRLVPRMIAESRDAGYATCVMMFDVDNFKVLNDVLGHEAGDRALIVIVGALEGAMRGSDVCGRWGGDEFIVVMSLPPGTSALTAVDRLRWHAELALIAEFPGLGLGLTAGFAVSSAEVRDFGALINAADDALVAGKRKTKSRSYASV